MGGCPERHITDPRNTRLEEKSRRQKNGGVFWGGPGPRRSCNTMDGRKRKYTSHVHVQACVFVHVCMHVIFASGIHMLCKIFYIQQIIWLCFRSKPLWQNTKLKLYQTLLWLILTCRTEACTMTTEEANLLRLFEWKIVRKICAYL